VAAPFIGGLKRFTEGNIAGGMEILSGAYPWSEAVGVAALCVHVASPRSRGGSVARSATSCRARGR